MPYTISGCSGPQLPPYSSTVTGPQWISSLTGMSSSSRGYYSRGSPIAMPMYALATVPLIKRLTPTVKQTWYADDAAATGKIASLRTWWDEISRLGPSYGYYANGSKTWLVTKEFKIEAEEVFADTSVQITVEDPIWVLHLAALLTSVNLSLRRFSSGQQSSERCQRLPVYSLMPLLLPLPMDYPANGHM